LKIVVDLQDRRPIWSMPSWVPGRIGAALPPGGRLVMIEAASDGSGDGSARIHPDVLAQVADADVYMGYGVPAALLERGRRLRWVHSGSAGVGGSLSPAMRASPVLFTNSAGVHANPIAETVLAMILHFARALDVAARAQTRGEWGSAEFYRADAPITELGRSTVGIVGFGGIGRALACRVAALGARVLGVKRAPRGTGAVPLEAVRPNGLPTVVIGSARVSSGRAALDELLVASDYVVLAAPGTDETAGLIGREELTRMKPSAVLVNVSRGALVDEGALVDALSAGRLRGAALDVFASEPLSAGHPLWGLPNVLITPHVSAVTRAFWEREVALITENLRRFRSGEPLLNVVDKQAGY
jgi:phosphoglycerate dehydrogenase-like enzyme